MSVELRYNPQTDEIHCDYGEVKNSWVAEWTNGEMLNMGPLILILADTDKVTANLAAFGVEFTVDGDIAKTVAKNGAWLHRLEPAHWADRRPQDSDEHILLGRWPD